MVVLDASVVLAHLLPDEDGERAESAMTAALAGEPVAPALLPFEVANTLQMRVRRGGLAADLRDDLLAHFLGLDIGLGPAGDLEEVVALADRHRLTAYDAAYLELAVRLGAPLATLDTELRRAGRIEGLEVWPQ